MKPLTAVALEKAAIMEGYAWEAAAAEVENKNESGARYFMQMATNLRQFYHNGGEPTDGPVPVPEEDSPRAPNAGIVAMAQRAFRR